MPRDKIRSSKEIWRAQEEFFDKVWYNRHQVLLEKEIRSGKYKVDAGSWKRAIAVAKRIEKKYGKKNLIYSDFDWGMINGKLSALRWVNGADWDMLDT